MNFIYNISILIVLFFFGCGGDPILDRANNIEKQETVAPKEKKQVSKPLVQPPQKKDVNGLPPKIEPPKVEPPKALPKEQVDPPPRNPKDGPFIKISGKITVEKWSGKKIRVDVFDGDQRKIGGNRPSVIISETLENIGAYSIDLPKSKKQLWIGAYIDEDEDGRPGPSDPSGWYKSNPLTASEDHSDINFSLDVPDAPLPK